MTAWAIPVLSIIAALLVSLFGYVLALSAKVERLMARQEIYDKVLAPHLAGIIKSNPHEPDRNELVEDLVNGELTRENARRLECLLEEFLEGTDGNDKRLAAAMLLARVRWQLTTKKEKP